MNILALDTATQLCSLALVKAGQLTTEINLTVKAGHSGSLLPAIAEAVLARMADGEPVASIRVSAGKQGQFKYTIR